jgi:magnesium-transporting ATPase (P-type)
MGRTACPRCGRAGRCCAFCAQFHNVLIYVLIGAAVVTGALQHWVDTGVILAVVLANAVIGFHPGGQGRGGDGGDPRHAGAAAAVLRDGRRVTVDGADLCPATSCCWRRATRCPPTCG